MIYTLSDIFEKPISGEWGKEVLEDERGTKVIRTTNFTNLGRLDLQDVVERNIDLEKYGNKLLRFGDIIIEKSGGSPTQPVGRTVIFDLDSNEKYVCNNFTAILRPTNNVYPKYSLYLLKDLYNKRKVLKFQNQTTGIINLKLNDYLLNTEVILPEFEIQEKIANVLDKSQELIDKRKAQIEALDELVKSQFVEMFGDINRNDKGWIQGKLKDYADVLTGYPFKSEKYSSDMSQMKICGGLIIMPDGIEWEKANFWNKNDIIGLEKYFLDADDIVLAMDRPWISAGLKIAMIKEYELPTLLIQRTARIRGTAINQYFLYYLLKNENFKVHCKPTETTVPHIAIGDIKNYLIPLPPIELQNQFSGFVNQADKLKFEMQKNLTQLENNFNSLMKKAFKGELFN